MFTQKKMSVCSSRNCSAGKKNQKPTGQTISSRSFRTENDSITGSLFQKQFFRKTILPDASINRIVFSVLFARTLSVFVTQTEGIAARSFYGRKQNFTLTKKKKAYIVSVFSFRPDPSVPYEPLRSG